MVAMEIRRFLEFSMDNFGSRGDFDICHQPVGRADLVGDVRFLPDYAGFATNSGRRTRVLLGLLVTQNGLWHLADPTRFNI